MEQQVHRTYDVEFINSIVNAPGVIELHCPPNSEAKSVDMTGPIEAGTVALFNGDTHLWMFQPISVGVYEVHTSVLPEGRGPRTAKLSRCAVDYMFTNTDAVEIWTRVPVYNEKAYGLAQACGFKNRFTVHGKWGGEDVRVMSLPIQVWAARATSYRELADYFYWVLDPREEAVEREEDKIRDQYLGITTSMLISGQEAKGVWFWNQYANVAFGQPVAITDVNPVEITTATHILKVENGDLTAEVR